MDSMNRELWPLYERDEQNQEDTSSKGGSNSAFTSAILEREDLPASPRLEVSNIIDSVPFSQKFMDLFDSLGLHIPPSAEQKQQRVRSCDLSYDIENFTDVNGTDSEWKHDELEEIVVMSPKRAFELSTIHEEPSMAMTPATDFGDFSFEGLDAKHGAQLSKDTRLCIRRDNGQRYVLKRRRMMKDPSWTEKTILEMIGNSSHPLIDTIRWTFHREDYAYLVFDHYPQGNLWDLVNQYGPLGSHRAAFYASELVSAISSLHAAGIMHRDLEPRNIALGADGHIVLTNFGRADSISTVRPQGFSSPVGFGDTMSEYRAPEIFLGWSHDCSVDCWSFGMLMYFMIFGTHPYGRREGVEDPRWLYDSVVVFSIPTESMRLIHPMARDLITKCLQRNPSMRWSMEKIKSHGYFELVDWEEVSAKGLDVPLFERKAMEVDRATFLNPNEPRRRYSSMNSDNGLLSNSLDSESNICGGRGASNAAHSSDIFRPLSIATIPAAIQEEDEPTSASASTGHVSLNGDEPPLALELAPIKRMSQFWAELDKEEQESAVSVTTNEFGGSHGIGYAKASVLRKYRSVMSSHRLFSLSTSSFQKKLRKKPRSAGSLRQVQQPEPIENLPLGLHQIGSGIGFTYNIPTEVPSKLSVHSFAPSCQHMFHVPGIHLGLGLGHPTKRMKPKARRPPGPAEPSTYLPNTREAGNGTFIRDMYRSPSWILSPPDSLPSPLALVNSDSDSPVAIGSEPLTPATLVDAVDQDEDHPEEVNISIPKNLEIDLDLDFRMWNHGSTLRLVPPPAPPAISESRESYVDIEEDSFYTQTTSMNGGLL